MKKWMIAACAAFLALPAMAQEDSLKDLPGYVDFGELSSIYGDPKVMINIGGYLLNFVAAATKDDPETAEIIKGLKGVRVNIYSTDGNTTPALQQVDKVKGMLKKGAWEPIVQVNDEGEQVQIFLKVAGDQMQGMTVMAVDDEEAVFLNIIGMIDPEHLQQVMNKFDVHLDGDVEAKVKVK